MLLYPWAHTRAPNPRLPRYARLAEVFLRKLPNAVYRCRQAVDWYPIIGDLDDWLDLTFGTAEKLFDWHCPEPSEVRV